MTMFYAKATEKSGVLHLFGRWQLVKESGEMRASCGRLAVPIGERHENPPTHRRCVRCEENLAALHRREARRRPYSR